MYFDIDLTEFKSVMNPDFRWLLDEIFEIIVLRGGSGSGKSISILQTMVYFILRDFEEPFSHRFLLLRKVRSTLKDSIFLDLNNIFKEWGLERLYNYNKTDKIYTFLNGSVIALGGLDDPMKIKSLSSVDKIFMEEATEFTLEDYRQLSIRMRGVGNYIYQVYLAFNPISRFNWIYDEFYLPKCPTNTKLHHSTYKSNIYYDERSKKLLESYITKDPQFYKVYTLGEWGIVEGIIYNQYKTINSWSKEITENVYGIDFGYIVPSSIVQVFVQDKDIYVNEKLYKTKLTNSDLIDWIKKNLNPKDKFYCDSAEPDRIKEMQNAGINALKAYKGPKSVKDGIDYIKRHNIYVTKYSQNLVKEIEGYKWQDSMRSGENKEQPVKVNDHLMDAMRYGIFTHWGRKRTFKVYV